MTDFASATLDTHQRAKLLDELAAYSETDLLCYFAQEEALYAQQLQHFEPVLRALEAHFDVHITRTQGVMPAAQPPQLKAQCDAFLRDYDDAALVALAQLITSFGSILLAIALLLEMVLLEEALTAATLDEDYQRREWGEDEDIAQKLEQRAEKIRTAYGYLQSLGKAA